MAALAEALAGERALVVAREITKKFETIARMPLAEASAWFAADANRERGEFVLLVDAPDAPAAATRRRVRSTPTACSRARRRVAAGARRARRGGGDRPAARRALRAGAGAEGRGALTPPVNGRCRRAAPRTAVATARATPSGWEAHLELEFRREAARTVLSTRRHTGPLRVQKALYPEGADVCQAIVVHPPGGIVGGDSLAIDVDVGTGAHAQLTTPGATKWYRSAGSVARAETALRVAAGAVLEWLPQEAMLFDGARASIALRVDLAPGARFIGWDVICLGRTASGERFDVGRAAPESSSFVARTRCSIASAR